MLEPAHLAARRDVLKDREQGDEIELHIITNIIAGELTRTSRKPGRATGAGRVDRFPCTPDSGEGPRELTLVTADVQNATSGPEVRPGLRYPPALKQAVDQLHGRLLSTFIRVPGRPCRGRSKRN